MFDLNRFIENPVQEISGSMSEELRGNPLHEPTETEKHIKMKDAKKHTAIYFHDLPDWLQDFRENFVDERDPSNH